MNPRAVFVTDYLVSAFLLAIKGKKKGLSAIKLAYVFLLQSWGISIQDIEEGEIAYLEFVNRFFDKSTDTSSEMDARINRLLEGLSAHEPKRQMLFVQYSTLACLDADLDADEKGFLQFFEKRLDLKPSEAAKLFDQGASIQNMLIRFIDTWIEEVD